MQLVHVMFNVMPHCILLLSLPPLWMNHDRQGLRAQSLDDIQGAQQQLCLRRGLPVLVEHPALQAGVAAHDCKRYLGERSAETHLCRLLRLLQTLSLKPYPRCLALSLVLPCTRCRWPGILQRTLHDIPFE